jgi:hypothetical protein
MVTPRYDRDRQNIKVTIARGQAKNKVAQRRRQAKDSATLTRGQAKNTVTQYPGKTI